MLWRLRKELLLLACMLVSALLVRYGGFRQPAPAPSRHLDLSDNVEELRRENSRFRRLLGLRERDGSLGRLIVAEVVRGAPAVYPGELIINRGSADGVRAGMPVRSADGWLVGRVVAVDEGSATVRTLYDRETRVSVMFGSSRELGILQGGTYPTLWVKYVSRDSPPAVREEVVTSGLSEFYPKGIPVGRVCVVGKPQEEFFVQVGVRPHLGSALVEEVLVGR